MAIKINYVPLSKAKELLAGLSKERELNDIQASALKHVTKFSKIPEKKAEKLKDEIASLGIEEMLAVKVVDVMPANLDELRSVLYPRLQNLDENLGNKVLELVSKSR